MPNDTKSETAKFYDVIAVNIESGAERVIADREPKDGAEAIMNMAVGRRGVDEEFFKVVPHVER
jgi:hypothetical protein